MTNGSISNLNGHLFAALERLAAPGLTGKSLADEVARAEAIVQIADQITESNRTAIGAAKLFAEHGSKVMDYLPKVGRIDSPAQIEAKAEK